MRAVIAAVALVSLAVACAPDGARSDPWRRAPRDDPGPFGMRPPGMVSGDGDAPPPVPPEDRPPEDAPPDQPPPDAPPPDEPPPDEPPPDEPPPDEPPPDEPPAQCAGGPLDLPIDGCAPAPLPSTGDAHQDCVTRINQFRAECQCLPPLQRWTSGEDCADRMAESDHDSGQAHGAAGQGMCEWGSGQNECPGWGSVDDVIGGCLQMMWDEGPGENFWAHGHYLHMSSLEKTHVACGFFDGPNGTWAVQNFY
ncbi:MAG: hypothetical protein HYS27_03735 [Deltaproteobacteria bacterium]|nr:hypothetical protein [Deltaproteobacteria bacterium]